MKMRPMECSDDEDFGDVSPKLVNALTSKIGRRKKRGQTKKGKPAFVKGGMMKMPAVPMGKKMLMEE